MVVAAVPWARHDAGHTFAFDDTVAWLAVKTSKTAVTQLMRIAWRSVGAIVARPQSKAFSGIQDFDECASLLGQLTCAAPQWSRPRMSVNRLNQNCFSCHGNAR